NQNLPELLQRKTIVTVSGGVDSMVLLHLFQNLELDFAVAHCNFHLRAKESDLDEELVKKYCHEHQIPVFVKHFDTEVYSTLHHVSIQIAARELRYAWFKKLCTEYQYDFIVTAHHLDDQVETFLINFTRGTGINGFLGIPETNQNIVRPLLPFSRDEIQEYAILNQVPWREDASNATTKYLRNKMRHLVIPVLKEENEQFLKSFQNTLNHLTQTQTMALTALDFFKKQCVQQNENLTEIDLEKALDFPNYETFLSTFLIDFGFTSSVEIQKIIQSETGKVLKNDKFSLLKNRQKLLIQENQEENLSKFYINSVNDFGSLPISIELAEVFALKEESNKDIIFVDAQLLKWPLTVRKIEEGDLFQPFGLNGFKKVSKFFKDEKLSIFEKKSKWLLVNNDNKIIWVVGMRADDRFRVTSNTIKIYKLSLNQ
ncbi:MAG TPA: tRNA lysidine(34) synthetase TilS, partial [Flavobacterium sp.]|nr:tRNA lysidine(34) synthetase TilS [Flavobacterium sp.]